MVSSLSLTPPDIKLLTDRDVTVLQNVFRVPCVAGISTPSKTLPELEQDRTLPSCPKRELIRAGFQAIYQGREQVPRGHPCCCGRPTTTVSSLVHVIWMLAGPGVGLGRQPGRPGTVR